MPATYDYVGIGGGGGGAGKIVAGGAGTAGDLTVNNATLTVNRSLLLGGSGGGSSIVGIGGRGGDGALTLMGSSLSVAGTLLIGGAGGGSADASYTGGQGGNGTLTVGGNSTVAIGSGARVQLGGGTGGGTGVFNLGPGTANFAGGGAFTIDGNGTLNIGGASPGVATGGTIVNLTSLVNNGLINFNQSDAGSYVLTPAIAGSGSVAVNSSGTTVLTGNNTYTGGTTVSAGTLQIGAGATTGSIAGNIVNNASVVFSRSDTVDYAGAMSGSGNLANNGTGMLRLLGASTGTGDVYVNRGTVELTGATARQGSGTSEIIVGSMADATLTVSAGAQLNSHDIQIGSNGTGTAIVTGADSKWTAFYFNVGAGGLGELRLLDGGQLSVARVFVGLYSNGTALVSGANSRLDTATGILLGNLPGTTGSLVIEKGATASAPRVEIGGQGGSLFVYGLDPALRGVLETGPIIRHAGTATGTVDFDGGILRATTAQADLFQGFSAGDVTLGANGMYLDSDGFDVGISTGLGGTGRLTKTGGGTLTLAGVNTYSGGTEIQSGTLSVASDANLGAAGGGLAMAGGTLTTTASFDSARNVSLVQNGIFNVAAGIELGLAGTVSGAGALVKDGAGTLTLSGANTHASTQVLAGSLIGDSASIRGNLLNNGTAIFNQSVDGSASGVFTGSGAFEKRGMGVLSLTADSSAFAGSTRVRGGVLTVANQLGGSADVIGARLNVTGTLLGGATIGSLGFLSGSGTIGQNVSVTGGTLQGAQGGTLTINGDLALDNASRVNVALGSAPSSNALFDVGGNLALAGTLNVSDQGGFGPGIYRLFNYGGALTSNTLALGSAPTGVLPGDLRIQTAVGGQVNLASTSGATLGFWDGGNSAGHDNGIINGGTGAWRADGRNWTNLDGTLNGVFQPNPTFAVFQGQAGTVTVDTSAGAIGVTGMQIATDGYRIEGDDIALQGAGGESVIRVGSGLAAGAGMTGTIASRLTGASTLAKTDYGTLILAGDNTYTGGTDVRLGTVSVSNDANLGAATGGLTLSGGVLATTASFNTNRAVTLTPGQASGINVASATTLGLSGTITGSGDMSKTGAGVLNIAGDGSAYAGNLLVQAGVLNMASAGKLGGTLTMANGTLLQGTGQVGTTTLQNGAVLAPGNANSTLKVAGDLTFMPGSVYQVSADPASSASSRVAVSGAANLAGSLVHVGPESGFESTRQYTILTAGSVNGQFNAVSSNYAFLAPTLRYGAQDVTLQLGRKQVPVDPTTPITPTPPTEPAAPTPPSRPIAFADAARTGNQRAVANALDSLPAGNALHEYILTLPDGAPPAAFNSLSGEAHASVASSLMGSAGTTRTLPLSHLRANLNAGMRPGSPTAQAGGTLSASALPSSNAQPAWAELVGNWQTQNATDNTAQVRQHTGGLFVGADHAVGSGWRLGAALGYTDSKIRVDDRASKADVSGYSAAVYGGKSFDAGSGKLNLLVGTSYTWHDVASERYASVAGASQKLTADYGASTAQLFTELGYALPLSDRTTLEPFAGVAWSDLRSRSFSESGGSAALSGQSSSNKQTSSTLGVRTQTNVSLAGAEARLQATLGWRHAFGDVLPRSTMAFDGGQAFTVSGAPIARNAAIAELGGEVAVSRNASLGLNYSGQYGGGNREHAGSLNVRWRY
ncbi:autotransporter domain-containing protein [Achromobacter sp. ES-001]|nr:autotransporter domain-containing protein [Achromobacter sp. ES-001]